MTNVLFPNLQQRSAKDGKCHRKVDDQSRHIDKGGDEWGGESPDRIRAVFSTNGSREPTSDPQRTTPTSANPTVTATSNQCGP